MGSKQRCPNGALSHRISHAIPVWPPRPTTKAPTSSRPEADGADERRVARMAGQGLLRKLPLRPPVRQNRPGVYSPAVRAEGCNDVYHTRLSAGSLCYIVAETSLGERNGQHERTAWEWRKRAILRPAVLSVLLSILASKRVVLNRQHGRNRLGRGVGSPVESAK